MTPEAETRQLEQSITYTGNFHDWQKMEGMFTHKSYPVMDKCPRCKALARFEIKRNFPVDQPHPPGYTESCAYLCYDCEITLVTRRVLVEL